MEWMIPHQDGVKVYVNQGQTITIEQTTGSEHFEDPSIVTVHPDHVDALIEFLEQARDQIKEDVLEEAPFRPF